MNFTFVNRDNNHWDVCSQYGRVFAIRGGAYDGKDFYWIRDERILPDPHLSDVEFTTLSTAVAWIADLLMK